MRQIWRIFHGLATTVINPAVLNVVPHDKSVDTITSTIIQLKKDLSLISMVDEFAKHARLQRKISKLQDERKSLIAEKSARKDKIRYSFFSVIYGITSVTLLILIFMYKGEPVAQLPSELLWPLPKMFNWFSDIPGLISVPSWVVMSSTSFRIISKCF